MKDTGGTPSDVGRAALERALEEKDLVLVYQPIHDLKGTIVAAEALVRQRRQSGELREASIITETAEGQRGPELFVLESRLVRMAYRDARSWQATSPDVHLNVNLSPREFTEGRIVERLEEVLGECGTEAGRVNLEITETSYIEHPEETVEVLDALRRRGFQLWLDDFGTRHSSMTHLLHFPSDGLKLAGTFVSGITTDRKSRVICRSLITLAHDLGLAVIAEEVETAEQRDILAEAGCDFVQGFLYSRPMPLEEFRRLLVPAGRTSTPPERTGPGGGRDRASRSS